MGIIAQEHDDGVTPEKLRTWQSHVEAWQLNHKYKPNPYAEPVLGEYNTGFSIVLTEVS
jgi:hypothetical protein